MGLHIAMYAPARTKSEKNVPRIQTHISIWLFFTISPQKPESFLCQPPKNFVATQAGWIFCIGSNGTFGNGYSLKNANSGLIMERQSNNLKLLDYGAIFNLI